MAILTLNAGSSSLKFALFETPDWRIAGGTVEGIGGGARLTGIAGGRPVEAPDVDAALAVALRSLPDARVDRVGHRIVHGGDRTGPARLDAGEIAALGALTPLAPLHQPANLAGIRAAAAAFPGALQVGAFDTAFHAGKRFVHDAYALPRALRAEGVRRYGFHGLSYQSVHARLAADEPDLAEGRLAIAHLGNGASVCAVRDGRSVACSMGFSPGEGLPMGTRAGSVDPGVILWLMRQKGMGPDEVEDLLMRRSGLLALSEVSNDMRAILAAGTREAEEAVAFFCGRVAEEIARMAIALGGLDAVVLCGGIGENSGPVREQVQGLLQPLSVGLRGGPPLRIVPTDEEAAIAGAAASA